MLLLLSVAVASVSYHDPQNRFSISLPDGWTSLKTVSVGEGSPAGPRPVGFRRQLDTLQAHAAVQVMENKRADTLVEVARDSARALSETPGYRLVSEGEGKLGEHKAFRRRYVTSFGEQTKSQKMSEDRWVITFGRVYVVHVESPAESFDLFAREFEALFWGFQPSAGDPIGLIDSPVVGRWFMAKDPSTLLDLRADGTFVFSPLQGTYAVQGEVLVLRPFGADAERFNWQRRGNDLTLYSDAIGERILYHREQRGKSAQQRDKKP